MTTPEGPKDDGSSSGSGTAHETLRVNKAALIQVEKLTDTSNFGLWRTDMKDALVSLNLEEVLNAVEKPDVFSERQWTKMNLLVIASIRSTLDASIRVQYQQETSAKDLWKKLEDKYLVKDVANRIHLKRRLYRFNMKRRTALTKHLDEFEKLLADLVNYDEIIGDEDKAVCLFNSLPPEYEPFVLAMIHASEDVVAEYYQQQIEMLEGFNEMDALAERGFLPGMSKEERESLARSETMAIRISNFANMILFVAKVYASIRSGSLAIIASTLDSLLDLLSGFILWFTAFSMKTQNPYQYPIGKKRMQPLGILVFASVMATLGLQIILESVRKLASDEAEFNMTKEQEAWVISIMLSVTVVKLALAVYCRSFTNEIVKAYAQDHLFDVITNVIGLIAALLANYLRDWMDPVGAIVLALYTIRTWSFTVLENVNSLVGKSAAPEYLQKLTYLCWNHHKAIRHLDTVRAYTFGSHYFVEVDIVLPSNMPLREAHDIGESLQEKLELLPEIERAFVHLDYEFTHKPEHAQSHY